MRALADTALTYLTREPQARSLRSSFGPLVRCLSDEAAPAATASYRGDGAAGANVPQAKAEIEKPPTTLPSLLRYVDHILMRDESLHNYPPYPAQKCISCNTQWDRVAIPSTFLPLSPCSHWIHYRCLIELAIRGGDSQKGTCHTCNTPLYEWDGINALTLAWRTDLPIEKDQTSAVSPKTYTLIASSKDWYEEECEFIEKLIERRFFNQLTKPSGFSDYSPDLVQCFNNTLSDLRLLERPTSKWLMWSTQTGSLLFGMLVAIKMQRFLTERHNKIKQTEAWVAWEEGCRKIQANILKEVHRE
ncbi:uncharacterized protein M421DRAFT_96153 [Didymella exigua CBS 183.55]|uniref:RING-type domain-containing protein n=1 Tax=Didymella exigua CBS 183.55 TaxID=1150837 RepID=A0A6A5R6N4_9PLEO|nr:uncharacterized protein M421DRAFT_96153 [Didymella exigua CBS 183.55]KAF1923362.1 hypothetical protein M421DRAFT_96153 [Didymella exigua CBS 183.55]